MKKCGIILMILLLCASLPLVKTNAQKTSKIEKLMEYLVDNDTLKFQKNRSKIDTETLDYYPEEMALVDAINELWYGQNTDAAQKYLAYYRLTTENFFPSICEKGKIDIAQVRTRSDETIVGLLAGASDKIAFSRTLIDTIEGTHYPMKQQELVAIYNIREEALLGKALQSPSPQLCELYLKEYPQGRFLFQVMNRYDDVLFQTLKKSPTPGTFKLYFENDTVNTFFGNSDNRKSMSQARSLYDDYLYQLIQQPQELAALKSSIDNYHANKYASSSDRKYEALLAYKTDSVDYELLKVEVVSADKLGLIKDYLLTHHYKEFRDKANALRATFEEHVIWQSPSYTYAYSKGKLMKSTQAQAGKTVTNTYTYGDKGELKRVDASVIENGQESLLTTNYVFDSNGRCTLESQVDPKSGTESYRRSSTFTPTGVLLADSVRYTDGRLLLRAYNERGLVAAEREYANGKQLMTASYEYGDKGEIHKGVYSYSMPDSLQPTYVISQTETYEYDVYGYLKRRLIEKTQVNNTQSQSVLTYLYDDWGNPIDSNAYYEYDHTGRWVRKTYTDNPANVEYVQCIYK